jgi:hypothetical protein
MECGSVKQPSMATIDQVARLQLDAQRCGCRLELENADQCLVELIELAGLAGVLCVEPRRQAEQREHLRRVEEERELDDPSL